MTLRKGLAIGVIALCFNTMAQAAALSPEDEAIYRMAFDAAHKRHFDVAQAAALTAQDKLLAKALEWDDDLSANSGAEFGQITGFMRANPDWPQQAVLERRAEEAITAATPQPALLDWFGQHAPVTIDGAIVYGKALLQQNRGDQAADLTRKLWISGTFSDAQQHAFLDAFAPLIRDQDNIARLDRLLWEHLDAAAREQTSRVDADHKLLAEARLALARDASNAVSLASQLPDSVKDDPGLIYEEVRYRRSHDDDDDGAIQLLRDPAHDQIRPDLWWTERSILIHRALQKGNGAIAYDIAQTHGQTSPADSAEAEFLTGWIALRFLGDARQGLDHFSHLYDHVTVPHSRSRAAYWAGRAADTLGQGDEAVRWYALAARNVTTFYGQLAAGHVQPDQDEALPADPEPTPADIARIEQLETTQTARLLAQIGEADLARLFLAKNIDLARTPGERELVATLAIGQGQPDIAVVIARQSERQGAPMIQAGYPIVATAADDPAPEQALVLSLILKESAFHADLVSGAGARGLMQLLPGTAAQMAKSLKLANADKDAIAPQLIRDPALNVRLGSDYVGSLLTDFNGSYVLAVAAYNAGPNRVKRWLPDIGDPRTGVDPIDWIENIPYWETRDYVQRVLEAAQIYRRKLGAAHGVQLEQDLRR